MLRYTRLSVDVVCALFSSILRRSLLTVTRGLFLMLGGMLLLLRLQGLCQIATLFVALAALYLRLLVRMIGLLFAALAVILLSIWDISAIHRRLIQLDPLLLYRLKQTFACRGWRCGSSSLHHHLLLVWIYSSRYYRVRICRFDERRKGPLLILLTFLALGKFSILLIFASLLLIVG